MKHRFPRRTSVWWQATIAKYRRAGLQPAEFAAKVDAHPSTLLWWHRRLDEGLALRANANASGATRAHQGALAVRPSFVRVHVAPPAKPSPPSCRLLCEAQVGGLTLRVFADADPLAAAVLLAAVAREVPSC